MKVQKEMFKRSGRKACYIKRAKQNYGFDFTKEFAIYKNAMGLGLSILEQKMLCEHAMFDSYHKWEKYFIDKYSKLKKREIKELIKLMDIFAIHNKSSKSYSIICLTAIISLAFEKVYELFKEDINPFLQELKGVNACTDLSYGLLVVGILAIIIVLLIALLCDMLSTVAKEDETVAFCSSVKKILKKM